MREYKAVMHFNENKRTKVTVEKAIVQFATQRVHQNNYNILTRHGIVAPSAARKFMTHFYFSREFDGKICTREINQGKEEYLLSLSAAPKTALLHKEH